MHTAVAGLFVGQFSVSLSKRTKTQLGTVSRKFHQHSQILKKNYLFFFLCVFFFVVVCFSYEYRNICICNLINWREVHHQHRRELFL